MDLLRTVRLHLGDKNHAYLRQVAKDSGVSYFTLRKIVRGYTQAPSYDTAVRLIKYYETRRTHISRDDLAKNRLKRPAKAKIGKPGPLRKRK